MNKHILHKLPQIKPEKIFLLSGLLSVSSLLAATKVFAMSGMNGNTTVVDTKNMNPLMRFVEVNNPLFTPIDVTLDVICFILMLFAVYFIIKSIKEYGRSTLGIALIYLFNATFVLGAIKVIFILDDDSIGSYANVKDITEMTAWHTLFFYAILLFYLAGRTLTSLVSNQRGKSSYRNAMLLFIFSFFISTMIIFSMPMMALQDYLVTNLQNTWFETFGMFHIIALIMAGGIAIYLYGVKNKFKGYAGVIGDLYISIALLASIHAWELLNESWRWIIVSDNFGEFVERCIWIPVFLFILYSFIKLRKMATADVSATSTPPYVQPPSTLETHAQQEATITNIPLTQMQQSEDSQTAMESTPTMPNAVVSKETENTST